jgi:translation initiation factor IF-2
MATDKKVKRLSKVAKEFNVGIHTLVDFLNKKGYNVDTNPNAKVTPEQYQLLVKEYSSEIDVKRQSEKIGLNYSDEKSSVSVTDMDEEESEDTGNEEREDELLIKDVSGEKEDTTGTDEKEETEKTEEEEEEGEEAEKEKGHEPKVVGKIDLESFNKKKKTRKKEAPDKEEKKETPETEAGEEAEKKESEESRETPEQEVHESEKEESAEEEKEKEKATEETAEETDGKDIEADKQKEEEETREEETAEETTAQEGEEEAEAAAEEEEETGEETEEEKIKVVGKIDLDSLNQKTRPDKKTRKERELERKQKESEKQARDKSYREKTKEKSGEEKSKAASAEDSGKDEESKGGDTRPKRKRRKRIHKDKERVTIDEKKSTSQEDKKHVKKKKKKKRPVRKEIKEEDVQKQIKETLSRLESKGKSKAAKYRREKRQAINQKQKEEEEKQEQEKNTLKVTEFVSVNELASMMDVPVNDVIQTCMNLGLLVSINQRLDAETMALVADEYDYKVEFVSAEVHEAISDEDEEDEEDLEPRDPIVTVMGHVDHGKTSLLDYIRKENVIAGEAGGITQHIGAYQVEIEKDRNITFLDTPGHEAFTAMRARGAQVTDIAIIVVAADDNVMPQTIEAINHASAAGVPIIFAINKIDKPGASPERLKEELANMNYLVEDWGGKYQSQDISAKNGVNIDELLEKVLLEAEILELKANPNKQAKGTVIESWLDHGRGYISNLLVQSGTLKMGDVILAGSHMGRVKAMFNERGQNIDRVGPSRPVQILGVNGAPQAGDKFNVMESEKEAKEIANKRAQLEREQSMRTQKHITLDEIGRRIAIGNFKEVNLVVKGDVDGSIEALSDAFSKLSTEELQVNIIHKGIGQITESDILLAAASNAIIIGFQVRPSANARKLAEKEQIDIRLYSVIYDAINDMRDALEGMLSPEIKEKITGSAEVKETFKIKKVGTVAGCIVRDGKLERNSKVRVIRDGIVIYTGELESLKRYKDDVKEVREGYECGLNVKNYNDIKVGDYIEGFKEVEVKKTLDTSQQKA